MLYRLHHCSIAFGLHLLCSCMLWHAVVMQSNMYYDMCKILVHVVATAEPWVACGACSHLYYAAGLIQLLVLLAVVSTSHYISSTWGAWLVRAHRWCRTQLVQQMPHNLRCCHCLIRQDA